MYSETIKTGTTRTFSIPFERLALTNRGIQQVMGYEKEAEEPFPEMIGEALLKASDITEISAGIVLVDKAGVDPESKNISVRDAANSDHVFEIGRIIYHQLKKAEMIIVFLCTAGEAIGRLSRELMDKGDLLAGYIYDVIGSEIVEAAMDIVQNEIENEVAKTGLNITNRYSPGYCSWPVAEQQKLFRLLPPGFCGVKLLPSSLMQPQKSISGFIGLGPEVKRSAYGCSICDDEHCIYRRLKKR